MRQLKKMIGCEMGLYDSANGASLYAYKVVDMTSLCPKSKQLVIKYTKSVRGIIAQICNWYEKGKDLGTCVHYHIREITADWLANDSVFKMHAISVGADPNKLAKKIIANF